jgi:hypothetical protein
MEQNIRIKHKLNEINHDYQVLRRRALFRQKARLSKQDKLKRKHEADIHRTIGVEAYSYMAKQRAKDRQDTIEAFVMATVMFCFIYACLFWVVLI